jgi:hypothetical protein
MKWEEVRELYPNHILNSRFLIFALKDEKNVNCKKRSFWRILWKIMIF